MIEFDLPDPDGPDQRNLAVRKFKRSFLVELAAMCAAGLAAGALIRLVFL